MRNQANHCPRLRATQIMTFAIYPCQLAHRFVLSQAQPFLYVQRRQDNKIGHSLADEQDVHGTQIKLVEVWQGRETIISRVLAGI